MLLFNFVSFCEFMNGQNRFRKTGSFGIFPSAWFGYPLGAGRGVFASCLILFRNYSNAVLILPNLFRLFRQGFYFVFRSCSCTLTYLIYLFLKYIINLVQICSFVFFYISLNMKKIVSVELSKKREKTFRQNRSWTCIDFGLYSDLIFSKYRRLITRKWIVSL